MLGARVNVNTGDLGLVPLKDTAPKQRMDWPDIAKGLSILGVVLLHVTMAVPEANNTFLAHLNLLLDPLRMPLFFLVSGFFSVKVLNQSFGQLFRGRIWFYLVPYLFWAPINLYSYNLEAFVVAGVPLPESNWYLAVMVTAANMYWFLFFLVIFNIALWATRKFPGWAIVALMFVPWLFMPAFSEYELVRKTIIFMPAFFIGAYFRPLINNFAKAATNPTTIVVAFMLYVASLAVEVFSDSIRDRESYGVILRSLIHAKNGFATALGGQLTPMDLDHVSALLLRLLALPAGIVLCVWLGKIPPVATLLKFLGRHTLPIYIGHALGLTIFFGYGLRWNFMHIDNTSPSMWQWTSTWMVIAFMCAMLGAYMVHLISRVPVLGWTVVPPRLPAPVDLKQKKLEISNKRLVRSHSRSQA